MEKTGCNLTRNTSRTAQEVLDKIAHAMAQRRADETREELEQILKRIEIINANYELTYRSKPDMFQCIADLTELEELLKDQFMRKKFQDKVTIFVVGCHANIAENFILLQQVNDFFATSSTNFDDDFESFETDDLDMGAMSLAMKETLKTTETLINRLGEINLDLVQCLEQLEQKKTAKGRKKLEVALQQTKDDVTKLNQTLHCLQHGMQEKEEKIHQLDLKNKELMKLNSSAVSEAIKRNSIEVEVLKSVISNRDRQISQLEGDVRHLEKELASILAKFPPQLRQHPSLWIEPAVEIVPSSTSPSSSPSNILQQMHQLPDGDSTTKASDESTDSNEDPENMASYGGRTDSPDCNESQMIMEDFTSTESLDVRKIIREQNGATEIVIQKESKEDLASRYHPSFVKDAAKLTVGAQ